MGVGGYCKTYCTTPRINVPDASMRTVANRRHAAPSIPAHILRILNKLKCTSDNKMIFVGIGRFISMCMYVYCMFAFKDRHHMFWRLTRDCRLQSIIDVNVLYLTLLERSLFQYQLLHHLVGTCSFFHMHTLDRHHSPPMEKSSLHRQPPNVYRWRHIQLRESFHKPRVLHARKNVRYDLLFR